MTPSDSKSIHGQYVMPTYAPGITLVRGEGALVWDDSGKEYLDFMAGIAVNNVGHCHPAVVDAVRRQAGILMHCSNLSTTSSSPGWPGKSPKSASAEKYSSAIPAPKPTNASSSSPENGAPQTAATKSSA